MSYFPHHNRSPPPLQHPVPTHPAYIPEPPTTPVSPQGYQRYASSPPAQPSFAQPVLSQTQGSRVSHAYPNQQGAYNPVGSPPRQSAPAQGGVNIPNAPVDFSAWGINDATAQFSMQMGRSAVAAGQDYVQKNVCVAALPVHAHS